MKKFYLVGMFHIETKQMFFKFGTTKYRNLMDRFDVSKYPERCNYVDFVITPISEITLNDFNADALEKHFLSKFPPINISQMTGKKYHSNNLTGLSEIRCLTTYQLVETINEINNLKSP